MNYFMIEFLVFSHAKIVSLLFCSSERSIPAHFMHTCLSMYIRSLHHNWAAPITYPGIYNIG